MPKVAQQQHMLMFSITCVKPKCNSAGTIGQTGVEHVLGLFRKSSKLSHHSAQWLSCKAFLVVFFYVLLFDNYSNSRVLLKKNISNCSCLNLTLIIKTCLLRSKIKP